MKNLDKDKVEKDIIGFLNRNIETLPPYLRTVDNTYFLRTKLKEEDREPLQNYVQDKYGTKIDIYDAEKFEVPEDVVNQIIN